MKKIVIAGALLVSLVGCSKYFEKAKEDRAAASASAAAAAASGGATTTTGSTSMLDKALSLFSSGPFEGTVTMTETKASKDAPETIIMDIKGDKARIEGSMMHHGSAGGFAIFDGASKKVTVIDESKKMAIVMDMDKIGKDRPGAPPHKKSEIEKTGKTDTVAGYSCEIWKITKEDGGKGEVCVTKGFSFPAMGGGRDNWINDLLEEKTFPLRAVMNDAQGKEKERTEVTKVEKKSIDDARFTVPAGYQTTTMDDMMKSMTGGAMGRPHPH